MGGNIDSSHVPFSLPNRSHALIQEWRNLTFMHWEVDKKLLQKHIPSDVEIDLFEGKAYVGTIPFVMRNVRPKFLPPVPGISTFPEFNVRTYVKKNGIPGVLFLTLDAQSRITCWHAPNAYGLPYQYAKCKLKSNPDGYDWMSVRKKDGASLIGNCKFLGDSRKAKIGTLEYFLFERYSLYTMHKGKLHMAYTLHEPWTFEDAEVEIDSNTLTGQYNLDIDVYKPDYVHASRGVLVNTWTVQEVY